MSIISREKCKFFYTSDIMTIREDNKRGLTKKNAYITIIIHK